jgi:hypothetical protein
MYLGTTSYLVYGTISATPMLDFANFTEVPQSKWDEKTMSYVPDKPRPSKESDQIKWHISKLNVDKESKNTTAVGVEILDKGTL